MKVTKNLKSINPKPPSSSLGFLGGNYYSTQFLTVVNSGYFCVKVNNLERILTPKEQRSRDKWREKGRLAEIQATNGWSREELALHFQEEIELKRETPPPDVATHEIYNSADIVLAYLTPPRRKKKWDPLASIKITSYNVQARVFGFLLIINYSLLTIN